MISSHHWDTSYISLNWPLCQTGYMCARERVKSKRAPEDCLSYCEICWGAFKDFSVFFLLRPTHTPFSAQYTRVTCSGMAIASETNNVMFLFCFCPLVIDRHLCKTLWLIVDTFTSNFRSQTSTRSNRESAIHQRLCFFVSRCDKTQLFCCLKT